MVHRRGRTQDALLLVTWGVVSYHLWFHTFVFHEQHLRRHNITLETPRGVPRRPGLTVTAESPGTPPRGLGPPAKPLVDTSNPRYRRAQLRLAQVAKFAHEHPESEVNAASGNPKSKALNKRKPRRGAVGAGAKIAGTSSQGTDNNKDEHDLDDRSSESSDGIGHQPAGSNTTQAPLPGKPMARTVTAGSGAAGASWDHRATGKPGGIGAPRNSSAVQLYLLKQTHFHLHQAQFDSDGGRGGDVGNNGKARSAYLTYPVTKPDGSEEPTTYTFRAEDVHSLPDNDSHWSFSSCAIVSNSASMLRAQLGAEIDAHEAVWRINHAPIHRYELYVGSRTTFDVMNRPHVLKLSKMRKGVVRTLRRGQNASLVVFESTYSLVYYRLYSHLFLQFPFPGTVVLSPDLSQAIYEKWKELVSQWPELAHSCSGINTAATSEDRSDRKRCRFFKKDCEDALCKPSTGFFALLIAAQVCNSISMYGFEAFRYSETRAQTKTRYHYFDEEEGVTDIHSFELLMKVFEHLASQYPIVISTPGDPNRS